MGEFRMPSLGADMDAGSILEWRVAPGDVVRRGDIVAVVDTEKSDIEVEVFEDGVVEELLVDPGVEVPVGTPLARLGPLVTAEAPPVAAELPQAAPLGEPAEPPPEARAPRAFVRASPRARRRAEREGVDLAGTAGSGPGGAVVYDDLSPDAGRSVPAPPTPPPGPARRSSRQDAMRHAIGELMSRSAREIPQYHLATSIDLFTATRWVTETNEARSVRERILPAALLLKATALAARDAPGMNGIYDGGFRASADVHLGVAIALRGGGLVAPAIHHADRLSLDELMAALRDLVERARAGRLRSSEMSDPTLTVTNLGDQGVEDVFGLIYPPQVALVGFGRIAERPWAVEGMLAVHPVIRATLSADHRVTDGHAGAAFLSAIDRWLQKPEEL